MSAPPVLSAAKNLNNINFSSEELVENQALLQENRTLKVTHMPQGKAKAVAPKQVADDDNESILDAKDVKRLQRDGRSLVIFCYLWWDKLPVFGFDRSQCQEELDLLRAKLAKWYALPKEAQAAINNFTVKKRQAESRLDLLRVVEALYQEVPEKYHDLIKSDYTHLTMAMKDAASSLRSTSVFNMKKSANIIFEGIVPITAFANGHDQSTDQLCLTLLGYDSIRQRYAQCPKLLFPPGQGHKHGPALFRSPALVKVLSHVLLGPSSLTTGKKTRSMNAILWEKTAITPGAIAYAAVVRSMKGLAVASLQEASDEEEEAIVRGLYETEVDRETDIASSEEDTAANATFLAPQLTLRAPTVTAGTFLTSNYVEVGSDDDNDDIFNDDISDIVEDEDEDKIMANGTPPNTPIESITVTAETARLQDPAMHTKTVTFMLPGIDTQAAEPVENEATGSMAVQEALNGGRMVIRNGTQGSMGTRGGTRGRGGKWGSKCQGGKKKATESTKHTMRKDSSMGTDNNNILTELCTRQRRANRKSVPTAKALSTLKDLHRMKGLALGRYRNVNEAPSAELSMENNSDWCLEQAQSLATGLSEDFDDMGDAPPFLPEMAPSSEPEPPADYIRTEYHPHSGRQPRLDKVEEFQAQMGSRSTIASEDKPWSPFSSRDDFELAEWILEPGINQGNIDALLTMMIKRGGQFESSMFTVPLQDQSCEFTVYHRDLWSWTLDILQDPLLAPYLNWDAQQLFKVNGSTSQRFYMEPHTGNMFWEIQTTLPNGGKLICYIIYADKTQLSSFGVGGGHVIGWLPIVKEEPQHTGKSYYTNFKRAVWHKAFKFILSTIKDKSKFGAWVQVAGAAELRRAYRAPMKRMNYELQAGAQEIYEEAKKIRGATAHNTFLQKFSLRFVKNTFWDIMHCNIYRALSFDRLHVFNNGLFVDHLLEEIKKRMIKLGSSYAQLVDELLQAFPSWKDLYHFKQGFMNVMFTDGRKYEALSKLIFIAHAIFMAANDPIGYILLRALRVYMELDVYTSLTLHTSDTLRDGRVRIPIFAGVIEILRVDDWYNAMTYIRQQVRLETQTEDELVPASSTSSEADYAATASLHGGHGKGGGKLSMAEVEAKAEFDGFKCQDQISLYGMIKVNYSSIIDWSYTTDILRCSPNFNYHPRYDFVLLETNQGPMFAQLVLVFECVVHEKVYPLMLVRPFKEAIGPIMKKDHDLGFYQVRTRMMGNPLIVSIYSVT
ncbi:hypothetical protein IW261DRAFT_1416225 [Armillaria novae-zelandiae]|uniref:Uncharacterized protein n=1 Tax=Armillaria novae-zelandiae TaxID=153914 RepID=A0AA39PLD3_9AGAR|nr:hypothetical protein IW261DRAFT_1416225 [Armillaria novae-zelandiae]